MKSVRQHAEDIAALLDWAPEDARRRALASAVGMVISEALRDQRQLCAAAADDEAHTLDPCRVHAAVLNCKPPGT